MQIALILAWCLWKDFLDTLNNCLYISYFCPEIFYLFHNYVHVFSASGNRTELPPESEASYTGECEVCCNSRANILFEPCGHVIVCAECCIKMKRCLKCKKPITSKLAEGKRKKKDEDWLAPCLLCNCCLMLLLAATQPVWAKMLSLIRL